MPRKSLAVLAPGTAGVELPASPAVPTMADREGIPLLSMTPYRSERRDVGRHGIEM
ncbi:hypothetical protein Acid7E03_07400 [Acidisoma sp. 7E03]